VEEFYHRQKQWTSDEAPDPNWNIIIDKLFFPCYIGR